MIILDTNVISELMRATPSKTISSWLVQISPPEWYVTAISEAELFYGVARLPEGRRKRDLASTLEGIFRFELKDHVLPFDSAAARNFGDIVLARQRVGRSYDIRDAQIAAIARSCGAAVATRNVADFEHCGIKIINPWTD